MYVQRQGRELLHKFDGGDLQEPHCLEGGTEVATFSNVQPTSATKDSPLYSKSIQKLVVQKTSESSTEFEAARVFPPNGIQLAEVATSSPLYPT